MTNENLTIFSEEVMEDLTEDELGLKRILREDGFVKGEIPRFIRLRGCNSCVIVRRNEEETEHLYEPNSNLISACELAGCTSYGYSLEIPFIDPEEIFDIHYDEIGAKEEIKSIKRRFDEFYRMMRLSVDSLTDPKESSREYYDNRLIYEEEGIGYIEEYLSQEVELFLQNIKNKRILDLGSGPGRDSLFFRERGFKPVCIDISKLMAKRCYRKNLVTLIMDINHLGFRDNSFGGIWAYTSLIHLPKDNISKIMEEISRLLTYEGALFIGMKEGNFEGNFLNEDPMSVRRFISLYDDEEFSEILSNYFKIIHTSRTTSSRNNNYLNYLCKKV